MKKLLGMLMVFGAFSALADSYLYWMVNDGSYTSGSDYKYVTIAVKDSGGDVSYLSNYYYGDGAAISTAKVADRQTVGYEITDAYSEAGLGLYASLGTYAASGYSFAVELLNDSGFVAQSSGGWTDYTSLAQYVVSSPMAAPNTPWTPTGYAVPEPNSALLMLIGCAMLGLKRKKMLKA